MATAMNQEKLSAEHQRAENVAEKISNSSASGEIEAQDVELREREAARVLRKVDMRLVPMLSLLYLVAFIDRSNIGNAKIAGMTEELKMSGMQYNTAVTLFFVPYTLLEVPSNIVLKMMRPSHWMAILMFCWGLVMTLMGLTSSYGGLLAGRFFLGVTESGFFPAATFLLTLWYRRFELQRRMAVFYVAASLAGAFSGLLAYGIEKLDGRSGLAGWQWIFLLEGLIPVALSLFIWKILPDSPETAKFLTQPERDLLVARIADDSGSGQGRATNADKIGKAHIIAALRLEDLGCDSCFLGKHCGCLWIHSDCSICHQRSGLHQRQCTTSYHSDLRLRRHSHRHLCVGLRPDSHALPVHHRRILHRSVWLYRTVGHP